jgi:nitrogen-specific signal transduction histidine kinase
LLDAAEDAIVVYGTDGRTLRTNPRARARFLGRWGALPESIEEYRALVESGMPAGAERPRLAADDALDGRVGVREMDINMPNGRRERVHVHAAPIWGDDGELEGAVVISRDITELDRAIAERGRLDGAIKTVRLVAHELNNKLARVVGHADLLPRTDAPTAELVEEIVEGALEAAEILARLQQIARFEEVEGVLGPMLDLRAASAAPAR